MYINSVLAYVISVELTFLLKFQSVCVRVLCIRVHPHTCVYGKKSQIDQKAVYFHSSVARIHFSVRISSDIYF
jgi:hypothetical protein